MAADPERIFKTAWFAKASKKARISDEELCEAVRQAMLGQADDLGGGVFKKRLGKTCTAPSFSPRDAGTGSMPFFRKEGSSQH